MLKITICPSCGSDKLQKLCRDWTDEYRGKKYTVPALECYCCPDCDEKLYDRLAMAKNRSLFSSILEKAQSEGCIVYLKEFFLFKMVLETQELFS